MSMRTSRFPRLRSVITFTGLAVAVSACGSSAGGNAASSSSVPIAADSSKAPGAGGYGGYGGGAATAQPNTAVATVSVRRAGGLGDILADASGRTLYLFEQDWEHLTQVSRSELIRRRDPQVHRIPHVAGWQSAIRKTLRKLRLA